MRRLAVLAFGCMSALLSAQTPPIQPNLTPVPKPPTITLPLPSQSQISNPITAEEAAQIALRMQPNVAIARAQILAAQGRTQQVRAGLLPNASLSSSYDRTQSFRTSGSSGSSGSSGGSTGFNTSVALRQLLFDFNHTVDLVREAAARETAARQDLTATQANIALQVKQAFYVYQQDEQVVTVQEANLANTEGELALAQARLTAGLGAPADVLQAATTVGEASQQLTQARQTALTSRINLALLMGVDPRTPIQSAGSEEPSPPTDDVDSLVATALNQRPEVRSAQQVLKAAGFSLSAAKTGNAPNIGLNLSAGSRGPNDPFASQTGNVGISLNWDFLDGGSAAGATKVARADVQIAVANLQQASLQAVSDVAQAWVNLHSAQQRVDIAQSQVANATESVRLAEGRFRAGVSIFLEVTNAQTALVSARVNLVNAQSLVQQARAQLLHAIGSGATPVPVTAPKAK